MKIRDGLLSPRWRALLIGLVALGGAAVPLWLFSRTAPDFASVRAAYTSSQAYLLDRHGATLGAIRLDFSARRDEWIALRDISPALIAATLYSEDRRYESHHGVDWRGVLGAVRDHLIRHRARGASTITMQVASLLEQPGRRARGANGVLRKLRQIRLALALERRWSKPQILEAYFNLVTFRGELQGVAAVSHQLAGKNPSGLTAPEAWVLAALLPAPNATPTRVAGRACARARAWEQAQTQIQVRPQSQSQPQSQAQTQTQGQAPIQDSALVSAQPRLPTPALDDQLSCPALRETATTLLAGSDPVTDPNLAPQLAHALLHTAGQRVTTTLDAAVQRVVLDSLRNRLGDLADRNVRDGAVLVVDNDSGSVLAYVASGGPNSSAGSVDGVRAHRQAGSTLKPFLYGLAIERGYLTAASLLSDSSLTLDTISGAYIPQDYDHDFKGLVSVRTALGNSLNVPAVRTLMLTGVEAFRQRLHELGYEGITESGEFYGYSLALGSAEVSLWEQAQAYRALALGGRWSTLRLLADEAAPESKPLLPAAPTFVIGNILSDPAARGLTFGFDNYLNTPFWSAVKTGTSKDMRDNWCIGFSRQFTVAVWVGNFEGDAMHGVSGITGAAPIWHDVMLALHQAGAPDRPSPPPGVRQRMVRFSPAVEPPREEWFVEHGVVPNAAVPGAVATAVSKPAAPNAVAAAASKAAAPEAVTATAAQGEVARIENPANGMVIAIDPDIPPKHQRVPILIKGLQPGMRLKLNDETLGTAVEQQLWAPKTGSWRLALEDRDGRVVDQVLFTVR